jgi:hypothetical protein
MVNKNLHVFTLENPYETSILKILPLLRRLKNNDQNITIFDRDTVILRSKLILQF